MNQEDFNRLYDKLMRFAFYKAGRYFRDMVLREDAASEAVNEAIDASMKLDCYDEQTARRIIESSLRQSSRKRELEPTMIKKKEQNELGIDDGFHGFRIVRTDYEYPPEWETFTGEIDEES